MTSPDETTSLFVEAAEGDPRAKDTEPAGPGNPITISAVAIANRRARLRVAIFEGASSAIASEGTTYIHARRIGTRIVSVVAAYGALKIIHGSVARSGLPQSQSSVLPHA